MTRKAFPIRLAVAVGALFAGAYFLGAFAHDPQPVADPSPSSTAQMPAPAGAPSTPVPMADPTTTPEQAEAAAKATEAAEAAAAAADPASDDEADPTGMVVDLPAEENDAANDFALQVATELTTQVADEESRQTRLAPFFAPDSRGSSTDGPVADNTMATASPTVLNYQKPFDTGDPTLLGVDVSIQFDYSEPRSDGSSSFETGDVTWHLTLVRGGAGWLVSTVSMAS